jgi:hypothetical protein
MDKLTEWESVSDELRQLIGDITLSMTEIEASLDIVIMDLMVQPSVRCFFQRHVLGRRMINEKVQILKSYAKAHPERTNTDSDVALDHLEAIERASRERNRLVHDLHDVDWEDARITRRRLGHLDSTTIELADYRDLAGLLSIVAGPGMDALSETLAPPSAEKPTA